MELDGIRGDIMLPINDYQKLLYLALKKTGYKVFDEVPIDETLPLITISDYVLSEGDMKSDGYIIQQQIDLYSQYEGKKQVNEMVASVLKEVKEIENTMVNEDGYYIGWVRLLDSEILRMEDGIYVANLKFEIHLEEVI